MTLGGKDSSNRSRAGKSGSAVHSVSIPRSAALGGVRRRGGRRRSVSRRMRRFESALAQLEVTERLPSAAGMARFAAGSGRQRSKAISALLLVAAIAALVFIHSDDEWFVYAEDMQFSNLTYLDPAELVRQSDVEGWNILWLTPSQIRSRLLEHPYIVDATVSIRLPARVAVTVVETHPIALWVRQNETLWLAKDGAALPAAGPTDESLPQIIDVLGEAQAVGHADRQAMNADVLRSALALMDQLPELQNKVRYNQGVGLNFPMPGYGVWVYWGNGEDTESKMENLAAARIVLSASEELPQIVDVRYAYRPYYR